MQFPLPRLGQRHLSGLPTDEQTSTRGEHSPCKCPWTLPAFLSRLHGGSSPSCFFHCTTNPGICTSWEGGSYHFWSDSEEELNNFLMRVKEESEKAGLKLNIQKIKIMASGLVTSWHIEGKKWKQWKIFSFLGSKITVDSDCSHEIKRLLLLERKDVTNLDSILKSRDITLLIKVCVVKALVFPVVMYIMYGCERKKTNAFEPMVLEKTLQSPLNSKDIEPVNPKGIQSTLNIHLKGWCWSSNTLATWCEELTHWKRPWCWERLRQKEKRVVEDEMVR